MTLQRICVGVDGSPDSERALRWAAREARRRGVTVTVLSPGRRLARTAAERLGAGEADIVTATRLLDAEPRTDRDAGPALVRAVAAAELLVVGARGHGRVAAIGSVSSYVARHAPCPVVVVRPPRDTRSHRAVVGYDDSEAAQRALDWALDRAGAAGDDVVAIRSWPGPRLHGTNGVRPVPDDAAEECRHQQALLEALLPAWRDKYPSVHLTAEAVPGPPAEVLSAASEHADLVVVGASGRRPVTAALPGSVTQAVLRHSACPVVVAR